MLTLITGAPRQGKTLYTVWELLRGIPGSYVEGLNGEAVPRRLLCNIRELVLEHERLDADAMNRWHEIAQKGDVFCFDEVQEIWRPRAVGSKTPDCIQALETHGHKGVDIILITQHPNLVDANIRRLVNRHLHVRRLAPSWAMVYEWDHCGQPGQYKTCVNRSAWRYRKAGYQLYKSADLHTKPALVAIPKVAAVGVAALAFLVWKFPSVYGMVMERGKTDSHAVAPAPVRAASAPARAASGAVPGAPGQSSSPGAQLASWTAPRGRIMGCIQMGPRCECFDDSGARREVEPAACEEGAHRVGTVVPVDVGGMGGVPPMATGPGVPGAATGSREGASAPVQPGAINVPPAPERVPSLQDIARAYRAS